MPAICGKSRGTPAGQRPVSGPRSSRVRRGRSRRGRRPRAGGGRRRSGPEAGPPHGHDQAHAGAVRQAAQDLEQRAGKWGARAQLVARQRRHGATPGNSSSHAAPHVRLGGRHHQRDVRVGIPPQPGPASLALRSWMACTGVGSTPYEQRQVERDVVAELDEREEAGQPRVAAALHVLHGHAGRLRDPQRSARRVAAGVGRRAASSRKTARLDAATGGRLVQPISSLWSSFGKLVPEGRRLGVLVDLALPAARHRSRSARRRTPRPGGRCRRSANALAVFVAGRALWARTPRCRRAAAPRPRPRAPARRSARPAASRAASSGAER